MGQRRRTMRPVHTLFDHERPRACVFLPSDQDTASSFCHPCTQSSRSFSMAARRLRTIRLLTAAEWVRKAVDVPPAVCAIASVASLRLECEPLQQLFFIIYLVAMSFASVTSSRSE